MNETPTPPKGYRIIPRAYLEAGNPLPEDVVAYNIQPELDDYLSRWGPSLFAGKLVADWAQGYCIYATAQPLPCFQKGGDEPCPTSMPSASSAEVITTTETNAQDVGSNAPVAVQSPDQGPEHWADLCENDVIQDGDEWEIDGLWHPAEAIGCRVGDIRNRYRRRVAPEPPAGYRLLTDEEKKQPLPMDALAYLGEEWLPSRAAGRMAGKSDQRETTYATRLAASFDRQLETELAQAQAEAAAMRPLVEEMRADETTTMPSLLEVIREHNRRVDAALATTAGAELLERLRKAEAERDATEKELEEARRHIALAGGYHERTPREIEIVNALEDWPESEWDSADHAISELLALVDAGRNRLFTAEAERDAANALVARLAAALETALRQWRGYAENREDEDLQNATHLEGRMYKDAEAALAEVAKKPKD